MAFAEMPGPDGSGSIRCWGAVARPVRGSCDGALCSIDPLAGDCVHSRGAAGGLHERGDFGARRQHEYYWYDPTGTTSAWDVFAGALLTSTADGNLDWSPDETIFAASTITNFGTGQPYYWSILVGDTGGKSGIFLAGTTGADWLAWQPLP